MEMSPRQALLAKPDHSIHRQPQRLSKRKPAKYNDDESYTTGASLAMRCGMKCGKMSTLHGMAASRATSCQPRFTSCCIVATPYHGLNCTWDVQRVRPGLA